MNEQSSELNIVTEVGVFGSLNIDDPTVKKAKKKNKKLSDVEITTMIQESIEANKNI